MNPEQDYFEKSEANNDSNTVNRNNEVEARLYAASKNRKRNLAPRAPRDDDIPLPPPPQLSHPMQNYMITQQSVNPNISHSSFQPPVPPETLPPDNGTYPSYQRNPQAYAGAVPRSQSISGPYRPQRLKVPTVLTTPSPQIAILNRDIATPQLPYYLPPNMPNCPSGMSNTNSMQTAIVHQPGIHGVNGLMMATYDNAWVIPSQMPLNCLPGLEYLAEVDHLLIHQQLEILELMTGFETKNKYMVRNTLGQSIYFAAEESGCCNRQCLGPSRPFDLNFYDHYGNVVMHMHRPYACDSCCCPCCLQSIEISAPPGNVIGTIHQNWSLCLPRFSVKDVHGSTMMKIHGPFWTMSCCCNDVDFKIKTANGKINIGQITKQWSGFVQEAFTDTDNFSITFPMDMDITAKALLLAGVFLIDFMYYDI